MPATLKKDDWKKVLAQPKNVGLQAFGGTGISKLLDDLAKAESELNKAPTALNGQKVLLAAQLIVTRCTELIAKHGKLYTTACQYLGEVKVLANKRQNRMNVVLAMVREEKIQPDKLSKDQYIEFTKK